MTELFYKNLLSEVELKFTRSSGKGGQNVNKVSSKAELYFDVNASLILSDEQKQFLLQKLKNSSEARTQLDNKAFVKEKFIKLLKKAFHVKKKRVATKISKAAKEKRLSEKKAKSEIKKLRSQKF
jgi:ribosome-associated protein